MTSNIDKDRKAKLSVFTDNCYANLISVDVVQIEIADALGKRLRKVRRHSMPIAKPHHLLVGEPSLRAVRDVFFKELRLALGVMEIVSRVGRVSRMGSLSRRARCLQKPFVRVTINHCSRYICRMAYGSFLQEIKVVLEVM